MASIFGLFFVEFFSFRSVALPFAALISFTADEDFLITRWGTAKLKAAGFGSYDNHGHNIGEHAGGHTGHGPEPRSNAAAAPAAPRAGEIEPKLSNDEETESSFPRAEDLSRAVDHAHEHSHEHKSSNAISQILGVAILEFGVIFVSLHPDQPPAQPSD